MDYSANLSEQQSQFLDAMATQFKFGSDTLTVFFARFDKANRNQDNSLLAIKILWSREPEDKAQKLQDELTKICQVLEENGCPIEKPKRGRQPKGKSPWEKAFKWLWETKFIQWQQSQKELAQLIDIDTLVNQVREKVSADIQKRCGWMRVLDMTHPIGLNEIYTDVNILEKITGRRRLEMAQILENFNPEDFERFGLNPVIEKRVPGLAAVGQYPKLMILGKPGAGKTTFLKRIAIQCNSGEFLADHVPIFITLKDFAEVPHQPSLLEYIKDQFVINDILDSQIIKTLLIQGRAIILLDGLDEVRQADNDRVLREICKLSTQYNTNYFVISCRIASKEYTFEQFTEVEVADFNYEQITEFATKWFQTKEQTQAQTKEQTQAQAKSFLQKLQENQRIKELATSPLLLTLLCLIFGELSDFPSNRSELYQEGIDLLLKKWDGKRRIKRDLVYQKLSYERREHLLSKIALTTFEEVNYFFKEEIAKKYIRDYIQNLPEIQTDPDALLLDSEAVLKSIEAQHGLLVERARGIYSFSHLTFHEFFTARNIDSQQTFQQLVTHIADKRWREVFLLTVGMLKKADDLLLLMKKHIDEFLGNDKKLQQLLTWVNLKSSSVRASYKPVAIRAFYLTQFVKLWLERDIDQNLSLERDIDRNLSLERDIDRNLSLEHGLDRVLSLEGDLFFNLSLTSCFSLDCNLNSAVSLCYDLSRKLERTLSLCHDIELKRKLQELKYQLPDGRKENLDKFQQWWQTKSQSWAEQLRTVIINYCNIEHVWQINNNELQLLRQYYDANKLLVDCLNSECYVSRSVRQEIEDTLLLPVNRN